MQILNQKAGKFNKTLNPQNKNTMLKLKDIFLDTKKIQNESDYYLIIKILFENRESLRSVCYWSTSGPKGSLIEIGLEESTGLIFKINVVAAAILYQQDIIITHNNITEKIGLPIFDTTPWKPIPNPLGYHVEFYDPLFYSEKKNDFEQYAGEKNPSILFSSSPVVLLVVNDPVTFGFDSDNNLCYIRMQNMALNDEGFLQAVK
jgi:hypothetical protein